MTDFEYDCLQKKRLARNAIHRKNGSKSRKCNMSTDHMTAKEWKERNGKVVSVSFSKPTSWENFKELSKATQEEYLHTLSETYGANYANLSEMFGVSKNTIRRHIESSDLDIKFHVGHRMNAEQRNAWEGFLAQSVYEAAPRPQTEERPAAAAADEAAAVGENNAGEACLPMQMDRFSLSFSGRINVDEIANSLGHILGGNAIGQVEIMCRLAGRD